MIERDEMRRLVAEAVRAAEQARRTWEAHRDRLYVSSQESAVQVGLALRDAHRALEAAAAELRFHWTEA